MSGFTIAWRGLNGHGIAVTGKTHVTQLPGWVEARWDWGWRELTVFHAKTGHIVGRVETCADGTRSWWAEGSELPQPDRASPA